MRLYLVTLFLGFASTNGNVIKNVLGTVGNVIGDVGTAIIGVPKDVTTDVPKTLPNLNKDILQIMITGIETMKLPVETLSNVDGNSGQQFLIDLKDAIDRIQEPFANTFDDQGKLLKDINELSKSEGAIEEAGTIIAKYIYGVVEQEGSTVGKVALQQIADVPIGVAQQGINILQLSGYQVPQGVYDSIRKAIVTIESAKANIV